MISLHLKKSRTLRFAPLVLASCAFVACGGGNSSGTPPIGTIQGTATGGAPLANALIQITCKNGSANVSSDANGAYTATFAFDSPCEISATSGATVLHSFATGTGTANITPLTELLLTYLATQLNTTLDGLVSGVSTNPAFQSALTNRTVITNAANGVKTAIQQQYGVTLSTTSFLTVPLTPGQPADADLQQLLTKGAIQADGEPAPALVGAVIVAALGASTIPGGGFVNPTGGTGGTGGTGTAAP
jgi:hypothetical protein